MEPMNAVGEGLDRLGSMTREHRRAHGKVYTSPALAEFILELAAPTSEPLPGPVLDPAAGAGVFLVASLERMAAQFDLNEPSERRALAAKAKADLWGLDMDAGAVEIARKALCAALEQAIGEPVAPSTFDDNVVVGDFLNASFSPARAPGQKGSAALKQTMPRPRIIVGNPPYVPADRIDARAKLRYRELFSTAHGRLDLYTLFIEKAASSLEPGGVLAFITPDKYLSSVSASRLRDMLRGEGNLKSLSLFSSHRVFEDAATVPCVTVWHRNDPRNRPGGRPRSHVVVNRVSLAADVRRTPQVNETQLVDPARLTEGSWGFRRSRHQSLENQMTEGHRTLGDVTSRVSAGLTTGYNPAFILDLETAASLEPELVHPTVRGRDIAAHNICDRGEHMLVPYRWQSGQAQLVDLDDYPRARRWLERHRDKLEQRHCVRVWGKAWWDLHDPVNDPLHDTEKVLVPDLARSNRFASDLGRFVPQHSVYYLTSTVVESVTLSAILNSPAIEFLVRTRAPRVKDGFSRYRKQFLVDLPVPDVSEDTQRVMHAAVAQQRHDELADLTCALFGVETAKVQRALATLEI